MKPQAKERQKEGARQTNEKLGRKSQRDGSGKLPEPSSNGHSGETRDAAADAAGMGARTYDKAKAIVAAATVAAFTPFALCRVRASIRPVGPSRPWDAPAANHGTATAMPANPSQHGNGHALDPFRQDGAASELK